MQPLRILLVLETSGGGSGRHVLDLAGALTARGHRVHVAWSPRRAERAFVQRLADLPAVTAHALPMTRQPGPADGPALWRLRRLLRRAGPFDVVHAHSSKAGALARLATLGLPAATLYTPHAIYTMNPGLSVRQRRLYGAIERLLARLNCDRIIAVSREELDHLRALGLPEARLALVVNGVPPLPEERRRRWRAQVRAELGAGPDEVVVGFVGRMDRQKAPERFVAVAERLRHLAARWVMLGSGERAAAVDAAIAASGLGPRLRRLAEADGQTWLAGCDLFVMTSRYEAMPYVYLEALAAGLPIVTTDVGGAGTVVAPGENGHIVAQEAGVSGLAEAVCGLIEDPARRAAMARAARARARRFSLDAMVARTLDVYAAALAEAGAAVPV